MQICAIFTATFTLFALAAPLQQTRVSPHESVTGRVGDATLTITYGRPSMRGRTIFGALVPYDRVWCPGADEATTLDSDRPLQVGTLRVPPGPHTIWMLPTADAWTLVVSKEPSGFHTRYNAGADLGRVPLTRETLAAPVERLTFAVTPTPDGGGAIAMSWETTKVSIPVRVVR
jgi:DUF2911 family protein